MDNSYSKRKIIFDTYIDFWDKFYHYTQEIFTDDTFEYKKLFFNGKEMAILKRPFFINKNNPYIFCEKINEISYKIFYEYMFYKKDKKRPEPVTHLEKFARFVLETIEKEYRECESYISKEGIINTYEHKFSKFTIEHCTEIKVDGVVLNLGLCNTDYYEIKEYLKAIEWKEEEKRRDKEERKEDAKWKEICKKYNIE